MELYVPNEFHVSPFAEFYESISDSFIDIRAVADSLRALIPKGSTIFEIGLGTGYFASQFAADGYVIEGIQPPDEMLPILKRKHPTISIVGECILEEYEFTKSYDWIVSHSSVFLFTKHDIPFGRRGEVFTSFVFQSFVIGEALLTRCIEKTLLALTRNGVLFINIQTNPLASAVLDVSGGELIFDMTRCDYFMDIGIVEKTFRLSFKGHSYHVNDHRQCHSFLWFAREVAQAGFRAELTADRRWVMISRSECAPLRT
jgi:hypothetical protein